MLIHPSLLQSSHSWLVVCQKEGAKRYLLQMPPRGKPHLQASLPLSCLLEEHRSLGLSQLEHFSPAEKSLLALAISGAALPTQLQILTDAADCRGSANLCMLTFPSSWGLVMRILFLKDLVFFSPSLEYLKKIHSNKDHSLNRNTQPFPCTVDKSEASNTSGILNRVQGHAMRGQRLRNQVKSSLT